MKEGFRNDTEFTADLDQPRGGCLGCVHTAEERWM